MTNRFYFTSLKDYMISYTIKANNKIIKGNKMSLDLAPQASQEITVPVEGLKPQAGVDYLVNFVVTTTKQDGVSLPDTTSHSQFVLPVTADKTVYKAAGPS